MSRLNVVSPDSAPAPAEEIYADLKKKHGKVFNIFQGMANSPHALKAYLGMAGTLSEGELEPEDREVIYLAVSEHHQCNYCVAAHTAIARKVGMDEKETVKARKFQSDDPRRAALLQFVRRVIDTNGFVGQDEIEKVREAGVTDGQIAESIAYIGLATYSNLFNHVHDSKLDFPEAPKL